MCPATANPGKAAYVTNQANHKERKYFLKITNQAITKTFKDACSKQEKLNEKPRKAQRKAKKSSTKNQVPGKKGEQTFAKAEALEAQHQFHFRYDRRPGVILTRGEWKMIKYFKKT